VVVLDRLEAYKEHIGLEHAEPFVSALFDIGDDLPSDASGLFGIGPDMHAVRIIHWYLNREGDLKRRADLLERAIRDTVGLYLPVMKVSIESSRKSADSGTDFLVEESDLPRLQALCVAKIKEAAENGRLAAHPKLPYILYRWLEWGSSSDVRRWVGTLISADEGFLQFIAAFTQPVRIQGLGDYSVRTRWVLDLDSLQSLVDPTDLERRLGELKATDFRQGQARAIEALRAAIKKRREGKSTSAFADDDV
jgi:predicted KAP-like P-loop ATPase